MHPDQQNEFVKRFTSSFAVLHGECVGPCPASATGAMPAKQLSGALHDVANYILANFLAEKIGAR